MLYYIIREREEKRVLRPAVCGMTVFWDFNGTLCDDVDTALRCINTLLARRGLPVLPDAEAYRRIFGFPVRDYYVRAGFDFSEESFETVGAEWFSLYEAQSKEIGLRSGVREAMAVFRAAGLRQAVLSASQKDTLAAQLCALGLEFDEVLALDGIYAESKEALAAEWRQRHPEEPAVLIGDTAHDAEVARAAGLDCILVEGGHQDAATLAACGVTVARDIPEAARMVLEVNLCKTNA